MTVPTYSDDQDHTLTPNDAETLVHLHEVRVNALTGYASTIWNRFNWLLTLELALFGFYFTREGSVSENSTIVLGLPMLALLVTVLWGLIGYEDRRSIRRHQERCKETANELAKYFQKREVSLDSEKQNGPEFSQSSILVIFPALILVCWFGVFFLVAQ